MICQAMANLRVHDHLYAEALTILLQEDPAHRVVWNNFKTCMYQQYERMLQERDGWTLSTNGYGGAFNGVQSVETDILMASMVSYAKQLARISAKVSDL